MTNYLKVSSNADAPNVQLKKQKEPPIKKTEVEYSGDKSLASAKKERPSEESECSKSNQSQTVITLSMEGQFKNESQLQMPPEKSLADDLLDNAEEPEKKTGKEEDSHKLDGALSQKLSTPDDEDGAGQEQGLVFNIGLKENDSSSSDDLEFHKLPQVFATPSKTTNDKTDGSNAKQKDKQIEDAMQIEGCYFPKLDEMVDSDNNSQELNLAYPTFLDDSKQKKGLSKQDVSKKSQNIKDKVAPQNSDKQPAKLEKGARPTYLAEEFEKPQKRLKQPSIWDDSDLKKKDKLHDFSEFKVNSNSEKSGQSEPTIRGKKNAFGMDELLLNGNMEQDFAFREDGNSDRNYHNSRLRKKLDRHCETQPCDGDGLFAANQVEIDSEEELAGIEDDGRRERLQPESMVGKKRPEFKKKFVCDNPDMSTNSPKRISNEPAADLGANSDSCSAVSSNSDDEGNSSKSGGDRKSDNQKAFSSCSDDSQGTKSRIQNNRAKKVERKNKKQQLKENKKAKQRSESDRDSKCERVSKKYKLFIQKANKVLSSGRNQMACWNFASRDSVKYSYLKAIDYYKKSLAHCRNDRDKGRVFVLIAQAQIGLTTKLMDRDQQSKSVQKAIFYLGQTLSTCRDFDEKILLDLEDQLTILLSQHIMEKYDSAEHLCMIFEMIQQQVHCKMKNLTRYVVGELYKLYYKIACDIVELRTDTINARKYLNQCKKLEEKYGLLLGDPNALTKKLEECKEIEDEKKTTDRASRNDLTGLASGGDKKGYRDIKARSYLEQGLKLVQKNAITNHNEEAHRCFKKCLYYAKNSADTEAECLAHYHLGESLFWEGKEREKARGHLVDFQISSQMMKKSDKSPDILNKFKQASHLINMIMTKINKENLDRQAKKRAEFFKNHPEEKVKYEAQQKAKVEAKKEQQRAARKAQQARERAKQKAAQQKAKVEQQQKSKQQQRPRILTTKVLLDQVVAAQSGNAPAFMRFLRSKFAQKCKAIDLNPVWQKPTKAIIRKAVLKCISVFHPDKQSAADVVGDEFRNVNMLKVAEEVTKYLNLHLGKI